MQKSTFFPHQPPSFFQNSVNSRNTLILAHSKMLNITDVQPFLFGKEAPYKPLASSNASSRSSSPCASVSYYETENYSYNDRIAPPPPTRRNSINQHPNHHSHSHHPNHRTNHHYYSHSRSTSRTRRGSVSPSYYDEEEEEDDDEYPIHLRRTPKLNVKLIPVPIRGIRAAVTAANEKAKKRKEQNEAAKTTVGSSSGFVIGSSGSGRQKEKKKAIEDNLPNVRELNDRDREAVRSPLPPFFFSKGSKMIHNLIYFSMDRSLVGPIEYGGL